MKALISILSLILVMMVSGMTFASTSLTGEVETQQGFVKISKERELYVDYVAPKKGQPTLIILNGLTYSTIDWDDFVRPLQKHGVGILRYDMWGMGKTLLKYAPSVAPAKYEEQIEDLKKLLTVMKLKGPFNLVGLSYGGGIGLGFAGQYPKDVKNLILIAPYTEPLAGQYNWIMAQIWATRQMFPFNHSTDDELYDYFLHQIVYATYPQSEPVVLRNPFILESVYNMVRGIRKYRPIDDLDKLKVPTHLMVARKDQYIPADVLERFWANVPATAKRSRLFVNKSEHKIPEAVPNFAASWVYQIAIGNELLQNGTDFEGFPFDGIARSEKDVIRLNAGKE